MRLFTAAFCAPSLFMQPAPPKTIGLFTAASLALANMIGTGVFTSLGFQAADIHSTFALLAIWAIGGLIALCGALSYAELSAALPRSGGEYHLLGRIYHPALGFLSGWVSVTAGFAAPTAIAAMAFGAYGAAAFPGVSEKGLAVLLVLLVSVLHGSSLRWGSVFQNSFTGLKVTVILFFIAAGLGFAHPQPLTLLPVRADWAALASPAFAIALVYVSYAYTGWNAAVYIVGEMQNPQRALPKALFLSTAGVLLLYIGIHYAFLRIGPLEVYAGKAEVGHLAATQLFGPSAGKLLSLAVALLLVSTVGAMIFIGPRITQAMGEDYPALRWLSRRNRAGIPIPALLLQTAITLVFVLSATFEQVMVYAGFTLMALTSLAVAGVYVLRVRQPGLARPYKTWGYPVTPGIFLLANLWILAFVALERPLESVAGILLTAFGAGIYVVISSKKR